MMKIGTDTIFLFYDFKKMVSVPKKAGLTLLEILLATLLLSVVFLGVSSLYLANQRFYLTASDKVSIGYELQYALQHIYKNVMTGIGDKNNLAIQVASGNKEFTVRHIDKIDPGDSPTYGDYSDDIEIGYKIETNGTLLYDGNGDGAYEESLVPKVTLLLTDSATGEALSSFSLDGNTLIVKLTAEYPLARAGTKQRLTLYSSCYSRLNSYQ